MNKKGNLGLSILIALMIFVSGTVFINLLKGEVTNARTGLDCSNVAGISDGTKVTCLVVDWVIPYLILLIVSLAGGHIISKFMI